MSGWTFDEQFKAWAEREAVTLVTPNNTLGVVTSKDMEAAFLGGINSRDAEVQALRDPTPADLCSVCGNPAQPSLTINLLPVCTNCVRTGKAHNKEEPNE